MFRPMALTVIFALVCSLFLALTLMPVLCSFFLRRNIKEEEPRIIRWVKARYVPLLQRVIRHPGATIENTFTRNGNDWQHSPSGGPVIDGVNHQLNTTDETEDFWASGVVQHDTGGGTHLVANPEPGTGLLLGLGLLGLASTRRRGRRAR